MKKKYIFFAILIFIICVLSFASFSFIKYHVLPGNTEEVSFQSSQIKLSGLLIKPETKEKFPAIVIMHGSGEETADKIFYSLHTKEFWKKGFAVLIYDKRGCGKSGGDFETQSYADLTNDGIAAVNYLKSRSDIDTNKIGVMGNSESGWFTPEIASRVGNLKFIINRCGSPLNWIETNLHEVKFELLDAGVPEDEIPEILKLRERVWNYYIDEMGDTSSLITDERDYLNKELQKVKSKYDILAETLPEKLPEYDYEFYKLIAEDYSFDPAKFYQALKTPMLCIFAEEDLHTPPTKSINKLDYFVKEFSADITTKLFNGVGHNLLTWKGILNGGYVPGYLELITDWAVAKVSD